MAMRLQKIIALSGVASRREAERFIEQGQVTVNDILVTKQGTTADPATDRIRVNGRLLPPPKEKTYILVNKPRGCVTTTKDEKDRPTVMDLIKKIRVRVYPVGRLDYNTEGVLLITNDGDMADQLLDPKNKIPRTYQVKVSGIPVEKTLNKLRRGVNLDGRPTLPLEASVHRTTGKNCILELQLIEGKKHHIRRVCEKVGHPVIKITRTQFGPLTHDQLPPGAFRPLTIAEVKALRRLVAKKKAEPKPVEVTPKAATPRRTAAKRTTAKRTEPNKFVPRAKRASTGASAKSGSRTRSEKPGEPTKPGSRTQRVSTGRPAKPGPRTKTKKPMRQARSTKPKGKSP
ncbi:pseudouridine synthase [Nitrospina watsonii]|uniref:Pseudouridine synthase n=1 Tax=Nitrospina watsonii TaxID=1323948 RepID=A0ABN8VVM5_9BACT|nr:pseudouridine synthase [Nitrospina watsonii]CAI2717240.1 Pseudouridine synthase [Nitrospina watsonii]